jgi:hypothetical protein
MKPNKYFTKPSINHINETPDKITENLKCYAFSCNKEDDNNFLTIVIIEPSNNHYIKNTDKVIGFIGIDDKTMQVNGEGSVVLAFDKLGYKIVPKKKPIMERIENYLKDFWS